MGPLHAAVKRASLADVEKLLEKFDETGSPDPNGFDNTGRTPLIYAAEATANLDRQVRIAAALIDAGAEVGRRARADREGPTALHLAAAAGHAAMVRLLIDSITGFDRSAHAGAYSEDYTIDSVASVTSQAGYLETNMTPLLLACDAGRSDAAMALIAAGSNIEARSGSIQNTVLHFACRHRSPATLPVIQVALERGLRDEETPNRRTAIELAAITGSPHAIWAILAAGGSPDLWEVVTAATHGRVAAVKAFLEFAAANNIKSRHLVAALSGANEEIRRDLRHGATWGGGDARSSLMRGYGRIVALLVAAGCRHWERVPSPCRGLEAALPAVLEAAPEELPRLFERLEAPTQAHVRHVLMVLQRLFPVPGDYFLRRAVLAHVLADDGQ